MCCRSNGDQQEQGRGDGCVQQSEDRVKDGVECAELGMAATCRCWVGLLGHDPALPWTARAETVQLWESCFAAAHRPSLRGPTCLCPGRRRMQATKCWCPSCRLPGCDGYDVAVATMELSKAPGVKGASGRGVLISPSQWRQRLFWLLLRRTTADILHGAKMEFNRPECAVPSAAATRHCSGSKTQMLLLTSRVAGRPGSLLRPELLWSSEHVSRRRADKKPVRCERQPFGRILARGFVRSALDARSAPASGQQKNAHTHSHC